MAFAWSSGRLQGPARLRDMQVSGAAAAWRQRLDLVASVLLRRASLRAVRVKAGGAA